MFDVTMEQNANGNCLPGSPEFFNGLLTKDEGHILDQTQNETNVVIQESLCTTDMTSSRGSLYDQPSMTLSKDKTAFEGLVQDEDLVNGTKAKKDIDSGWAWMVLFASYMNLFLLSGVCYMGGMFQVVFLEQFHESVGYTAWVTALFASLMLLADCSLQTKIPELL